MDHEPCKYVTEHETTLRNGKWVLGATGSVVTFIFMIFGWVANDNLAGIRSDMKEAKGMLQASQLDMAKMKVDVEYLKQWKQEQERMVAKR